VTGGFDKRRCLVTGGSRGIGEAIARGLLAAGGEVIITGTSERRGWWDNEKHCTYHAVDFSDLMQVKQFAEAQSTQSITLLVNNAGVFHSDTFEAFPVDQWDEIMEVNVRAPMLLMGALVAGMREQGFGRIVNVGSIAGFVSRHGLAGYSASKAALIGLTRAAALDLANDQILVNCVCPAYTETDMLAGLDKKSRAALLEKVPLGRFCQPDEVARAVLFLLSADNTFITGQTLIIDGGVVIQ
jgi:NAD(P)-dependent dehydrogenase (short-subunit alcohol dehydrogenase family)